LKHWLKLIVAISLFAILFQLVDWRKSASILASASASLTIAAIAMSVIGLILSAYRWNVLLRAHSIWISHLDSIRFYWIGSFFSNYLPSNVGGDIVRATIAARPGKLAQVAASIVVERITGLTVLLLLSVCALLLRPEYFSAGGLLPFLWAGVIFALGIIFASAVSSERLTNLIDHFGHRAVRPPIQKIMGKIGKLVTAVNYYHNKPQTVLRTLLLAIVFYGTAIAFQYLVITAIGANLPIREVMLVAPLIPLVSIIPLSLNALGLAEGAFVLFYTQAGLSPTEALAAALLRRLVLLLVSVIGGLIWISDRRDRISENPERNR
jgi:uncharacterized protein (TIRG00374 family)